MTKYRFSDKQLVSFDNGRIQGTGRIVGVSSTSLPVIGASYMISLIDDNAGLPNETYPFSVISVPEIFIEENPKLPE